MRWRQRKLHILDVSLNSGIDSILAERRHDSGYKARSKQESGSLLL